MLQNVGGTVQGTQLVVTSLAARADYSALKPLTVDPKLHEPPELLMARYAVTIADGAGAAQLAPKAFGGARDTLAAAETAQSSKSSQTRERVPELARAAIQAAEDARRGGRGSARGRAARPAAWPDQRPGQQAGRSQYAHRQIPRRCGSPGRAAQGTASGEREPAPRDRAAAAERGQPPGARGRAVGPVAGHGGGRQGHHRAYHERWLQQGTSPT